MSICLTSLKLTQISHECGKLVLNEADRFTVLAAVVHSQHASTTKFISSRIGHKSVICILHVETESKFGMASYQWTVLY
jgi:hypothetical protein